MVESNLDIIKLRNGEHAEVKKFSHLVVEWTYNLVYNYVLNKEDAEEITQDVMIAALTSLDNFNGRSKLQTWVYSIAINKSKDYLKYKSRKKRSAKVISIDIINENRHSYEPVELVHPGIQLESKEQLKALYYGINSLPENQKNVLIMMKFDQKSQAEVAEILGVSVKAVESLMSRAKKNLKSCIEKKGISYFKK